MPSKQTSVVIEKLYTLTRKNNFGKLENWSEFLESESEQFMLT